jgi:sulfur relay (sulfurtransferase) DsrC/TusE family protein
MALILLRVEMSGKTMNRLKTYLKDFWEYYNTSPAIQKVLANA